MSDVESKTTEPEETIIPLAECDAETVTVFTDRAEVTREVVFKPPAQGKTPTLYTVVVQGMTACADSDSIRVKFKDADTGSPESSKLIREVSYGVHYRSRENENDSPRATAARAAKKEAQEELLTLRAQLKRIRERDGFVQGYMQSMLMTPANSNTAGAVAVAGPAAGASLETVEKLLAFHEKHSMDVDGNITALEEKVKEAQTKQQTAEAELRACQANSSGTYSSRDVTILLDGPIAANVASANEGSVTLTMTYIVTGASWSPIYDMRVDDLHADPAPTSLEVTYSGVIKQATGEDWNNVALRLSTASTPSGRGAPPLPPTRKAQWARHHIQFKQANLRSMTNMMMPQQSAMPQQSMPMMRARMARRERQLSVSMDSGSDSEDSCDADEAIAPNEPSEEGGEGGGGFKPSKTGVSATTFDIDRVMTIKGDNKEHKCTIGVVNCPATFRLFATPELEELAYIQARAVNSGALTFLESSRASVFLAGSFITKTPIKLTSPGQGFTVFLGTEAAVKVGHRVVKDKSTTGGKKKGILRGQTKSTRLVEYRTLLSNNLTRPIDITVVHLLPRASSDKIVVSLLAPPRKDVPVTGEKKTDKKESEDTGNSAGENALGANSVMQNKLTNNVVFTRTLGPQSKQELAFSYQIEWPHDAETGKVEVV